MCVRVWVKCNDRQELPIVIFKCFQSKHTTGDDRRTHQIMSSSKTSNAIRHSNQTAAATTTPIIISGHPKNKNGFSFAMMSASQIPNRLFNNHLIIILFARNLWTLQTINPLIHSLVHIYFCSHSVAHSPTYLSTPTAPTPAVSFPLCVWAFEDFWWVRSHRLSVEFFRYDFLVDHKHLMVEKVTVN